MGTREHRQRRVGTGRGKGGQQGGNGTGQANRPKPHVSKTAKGETRKMRKNPGCQTAKMGSQAVVEGGRDRKQVKGIAWKVRAAHGRKGQQHQQGA